MSVRKTIDLVKRAAEDAGVEWPDSNQSSAKRRRIEEPEGERIPSEHRLSLNCGS